MLSAETRNTSFHWLNVKWKKITEIGEGNGTFSLSRIFDKIENYIFKWREQLLIFLQWYTMHDHKPLRACHLSHTQSICSYAKCMFAMCHFSTYEKNGEQHSIRFEYDTNIPANVYVRCVWSHHSIGFFSLFHWIRAEEKIAIRACRLMFMCVHSRMEWNIITNVAWARMGNGIGGREEETEQNFLCTIIAPYLWSMLCIVHTQTHTHTRVHSPIKY